MIIPKYPAFNIFTGIASKTTALGPLCVATSISKLPGWDVEVIDENNYHYPAPIDERGMPDHSALQQLRPAAAVGFYGGLSCTVPRLLEVAAYYIQAGVLTIVGGQHLDALPQDALAAGMDIVVHGEGEIAAQEILQARDAGLALDGIAGISFLRDGRLVRTAPREPLEDFEPLPLPDFGLLRFATLRRFPINRIRGCGMDCEFCSVKGRARCATPERLLAQISYAAEAHGARDFFVVDDQFAQDRSETLRFCRLLRDYELRLGWRFNLAVQMRLDCARDTQLLQAMRDCGINFIAVGFESPIDEELRAMGKHLRGSEMVEQARILHRWGFFVHGMFIFGYPMLPGMDFSMSAAQRIRRFRTFIRQSQVDTVQVLLAVPIPGTALRTRLECEGRVLPASEIGWEYYDGNFPVFIPDPPLTPEQMQRAILKLMGAFYGFQRMLGTALHTLRFPLAMLPLVNLRTRFRHWYRQWYNDVVGSMGYFIVRNWLRAFRQGQFQEKLRRGKAQLDM